MKHTSVFQISGLDCPDCASKLEKKVRARNGVLQAILSFETARLSVTYDDSTVYATDIVDIVKSNGYSATLQGATAPPASTNSFWLRDQRARIVIASGMFLGIGSILELIYGQTLFVIALLIASAAIAGFRPVRSAISSLRHLVLDMNILMTVAVVGAFILRQWIEAATVMFLFALGTMLEAYSMDKTRTAIRGLIDLAPSDAIVKREGVLIAVPLKDIVIGDIVAVKPGERIPVDGEVTEGRSSVNQAEVTGESLPIFKDVGDVVYAGTLNFDGYLEIRTHKTSSDSMLATIIHMVEEAQIRKAPTQRFIDRFSGYYTPTVIAIAIAIATIPPLFGQPFITWFYRALVLLVISCPCALVISTPVAIVSAIGAASRNGVLIKGGSYLEAASHITTLVFDKTGTLTTGKLSVTDVVPLNGFSEDSIISLTASIEARSQHPLAEAVVSYAALKHIELREPQRFESMAGLGVKAEIDNATFYVGSPRLFEQLDINDPESAGVVSAMQREGKTVFLLGSDSKLQGIVAVADSLRSEAREAVRDLHASGISNVIMLTGDNSETAKEIADQAGIDQFRSNLLPEDKVKTVEQLAARYGKVAMVGDGINDAPAISRSDVGIAMGAIGSDVALETADIALMGDDLRAVPYTIKLSRNTLRIIKQNVAAAIIVKLVFIILALLGTATLWMAVFADTGIALLVILNGLRLFGQRAAYNG